MNPCPPAIAPEPLAVYSGQPIYVAAAQSVALSRQANITTQRIILNAGTGAYVITVVLGDGGATAGDIFRLILLFAASLNPSVKVQDSLAGTLTTAASTNYAYQTVLELTFNGVTWEIDEQSS